MRKQRTGGEFNGVTKTKVLFRFGTRAEYEALSKKDENSLYFLLDTNELYRGIVAIGTSHYYNGTTQNNETPVEAINRILTNHTPVINDLITIVDSAGRDNLFIYTGTNTWKQLNENIRGESIIFADGSTLADKLANVGTNLSVNNKVLELDNNILSIKDFGKRYYKYIPDVPAQGEEDSPDYTPAVPAHYELVTVDNNHPWKENLIPKTDSNGNLSWYEPNPSSLEEMQSTITNLQNLVTNIQNINNQLTVTIQSLQASMDDLSGMLAIVGTVADPVNDLPSTGLIARIEDLESLTLVHSVNIGNLNDRIDNLVTQAGVIEAISVNNIVQPNVNGTVNIPLFSDTAAGAVPSVNTILNSTIVSLDSINRDHTYLSTNGWNDPIGNLTWDNNEYPTVAEYVDARITDSIIKWETIT